MFRVICLIIGYCFGCIQTSYIIGKATKNIDIREHGSGGAGMTNTIRILGVRQGIFVLICDILKAAAAYMICTLIFDGSFAFRAGGGLGYLPGLYAGAGAVLGHVFPFYLKFKGGRGIASTIGIIFIFDWRIALFLLCTCVPFLFISNIVSAASLMMTGAFAVLVYALGFGNEAAALCLFIALLSYYQHRGNIGRLINGTENKLLKEHLFIKIRKKLRKETVQ